MKVINDNILVKVEDVEKTIAGGLVVPKNDDIQTKEGEVIEVGDGTKDITMKITKGNKVIFGRYAGTPVSIDNEDYLVIKQQDILVILP